MKKLIALLFTIALTTNVFASRKQGHSHSKKDIHNKHKSHDHHGHHHKHHKSHSHVHGTDCGHKAKKHDDHTDYAHDGHQHHQAEGHTHDCEGPKKKG